MADLRQEETMDEQEAMENARIAAEANDPATDRGDFEKGWKARGEFQGDVLVALNAPFSTSDGSDDPLRASAQGAMNAWIGGR